MFKIGDIVIVGTKGICQIENITKNAFSGCDKTKEYYVLKPVETSTNMMVFLPVDTPLKFRIPITKSKANEILNCFEKIEFPINLNNEDRFLILNQILKDVDIENQIMSFNFLMNKKTSSSKRNFGFQDQKLLNTLLDCISQELSFVLGESQFKIKETIMSKYKKKNA